MQTTISPFGTDGRRTLGIAELMVDSSPRDEATQGPKAMRGVCVCMLSFGSLRAFQGYSVLVGLTICEVQARAPQEILLLLASWVFTRDL